MYTHLIYMLYNVIHIYSLKCSYVIPLILLAIGAADLLLRCGPALPGPSRWFLQKLPGETSPAFRLP